MERYRQIISSCAHSHDIEQKLKIETLRSCTMIFADQAQEEIEKKLDPIFFSKVCGRITAHLDNQLARAVFNDYVTKSSELPPEEAFIMLNRARLWLDTHLSNLASGYSALRWLWMMRRIPHHVFSGVLATTFGYDQALAETLTARSQRLESRLEIKREGIISYSILGATVRRVVEFCAAARYLSNLHASLRWAGKGAEFSVKRNARPVVISEPELEDAVRLYDQRSSSGMPFQRSGT